MNPTTIGLAIQLIEGAIKMYPAIRADFEAMKAAGSATPETLADLEARIDALDKIRTASWAEADAALTAASKT